MKYAVNSVTTFKANLTTETTSAMWTAFTDSKWQVILSTQRICSCMFYLLFREFRVYRAIL